jgi:hypothetical protein
MNIGGRKELVKSVLSALPTYLLTTVKPSRKFYSAMDKLRKRFLWVGNQELQRVSARSIGVVSAGHCSMEVLALPIWSGLGEHCICAGYEVSGSNQTSRGATLSCRSTTLTEPCSQRQRVSRFGTAAQRDFGQHHGSKVTRWCWCFLTCSVTAEERTGLTCRN